MDARAGTPLTPLYSRNPSPSAAAENPSVGSGGLATVGAPPSIGLARSLFLPPQMTMATGGVAPAPSRATAAPSKLPNTVRPKKGKTSAKKNKAADGSGSSKARGKKLAGRLTGAAATEAPASSLVEPAADAHHMFDEMPPSLNDDAYMSTMGVGSNNSHWSQIMGGMGAPPAAMGGMSFDVPPHTHSHEDAVEDLANIVGASRDAVYDEVRDEDSSSEAEESSSEDEDEDEEED
ncbi:hypothetical protein D1007_10024 [Hordeum vulgare]|nr:hypothetical protein D1007_10024 [Hordeum vulgare]